MRHYAQVRQRTDKANAKCLFMAKDENNFNFNSEHAFNCCFEAKCVSVVTSASQATEFGPKLKKISVDTRLFDLWLMRDLIKGPDTVQVCERVFLTFIRGLSTFSEQMRPMSFSFSCLCR